MAKIKEKKPAKPDKLAGVYTDMNLLFAEVREIKEAVRGVNLRADALDEAICPRVAARLTALERASSARLHREGDEDAADIRRDSLKLSGKLYIPNSRLVHETDRHLLMVCHDQMEVNHV